MKNHLFKGLALLLCAGMLAGAAAGCKSSSAASGSQSASMPAKFVIAYLPGDATNKNGDVRAGMEKDLSKAIGIPVEEFQATDYNSIIEAMRTGKVDMALYGPLSFALASERADAVPVGMIGTKADGKSGAHYNSVFIVKADSAIKSLDDIKGKKIAFVDADSTSGNLVPAAELINHFSSQKLTVDDLHTNGKFFSSAIYSGSHPASMQAVIKGDVDVAPVATDEMKTAEQSGTVDGSKLRVIYTSVDIPNSPMAVWGKLPDSLIKKVTSFLTGYDNNDYFSKMLGYDGGCFFPTSVSDYKQIIELNNKLSS